MASIAREWRQVVADDQTEATFEVEGNGLLIITGNPTDWNLSMIAPDNSEVALTTFTGNAQQRYQAPFELTLKLSGTAGVKAWVKDIPTDTAGRLL